MTGPEYRAARLALGLTRDQLAERLNIGRRTVERIEAEGCTVVMGLAMERLAELVRVEQRGTEFAGTVARLRTQEQANANAR